MEPKPWPELEAEDRWLTDLLDRRLRATKQSPEQLLRRAGELREQAKQSELKGTREAALALAERYEHAAATRVSA